MALDTTDVDLSGRKIREYELLRRIGVGGMGVVYEGRHPVIGKRVAVKFLLTALSSDKDLVERFKAEARSVNEIGHRGIVDIFDFGQLEDGTQYFVMELLEGRAFDQVIKTDAPLHPALAVRYLEEIIDALAAAHSTGVIHRDIKPSNVFLVEGGKSRPYIKLLDFGIAKMNAPKTGSTPQTRQSVVIGTPEYIAPEQAQGRAISPATDLYAVGCMAYEMLTGKLPFRGENPLDTMFKHVTEPTPRVSEAVPSVPRQLDDLVFELMAKKIENRPPSAEAVRDRLEQSRGSLTVEGPIASLVNLPRPSAPAPRTSPVPAVGSDGPKTAPGDALGVADTYQSLPSVKVPAVAAAPRPLLVRPVVVLPILLTALALTVWIFVRPGPAPILVEAPPEKDPPVQPVVSPPPAEALDASTVKAVEPVVAPAVLAADAGAAKVTPPPPVKRGVSRAQLLARISTLERKLEEREAARGEKNKVFRSFLKQAKDDTESAKTDGDRKAVWVFLDDLARQLER